MDRLVAVLLTPWYIATVATTHAIVATYEVLGLAKDR